MVDAKASDMEESSQWNRKGVEFYSNDEFDKAIECYDKAIRLDPNNVYSWNNRGNVYLAKEAFDKGDFESAREGFQKLLKRYPDSENADNAQFWIGETYYREQWYEKAILEYQKVIEKYPEGNKVQASLLKQGFAFKNLGDKANAGLILKELVKKYPDSTEAEIARKKLQEFAP